jgi:hypothetical protein
MYVCMYVCMHAWGRRGAAPSGPGKPRRLPWLPATGASRPLLQAIARTVPTGKTAANSAAKSGSHFCAFALPTLRVTSALAPATCPGNCQSAATIDGTSPKRLPSALQRTAPCSAHALPPRAAQSPSTLGWTSALKHPELEQVAACRRQRSARFACSSMSRGIRHPLWSCRPWPTSPLWVGLVCSWLPAPSCLWSVNAP